MILENANFIIFTIDSDFKITSSHKNTSKILYFVLYYFTSFQNLNTI